MCWPAATRECIQGSWSGWDHLPRREGQAAGFSKLHLPEVPNRLHSCLSPGGREGRLALPSVPALCP